MRIKREIVSILDVAIAGKVSNLPREDKDAARDMAIFIRQRNRLAVDAGLPIIPVEDKDAQGKFIYGV